MQPLLRIVATADGVHEVAMWCGGAEGIRLHEALLPAIDAINRAVRGIKPQERIQEPPED